MDTDLQAWCREIRSRYVIHWLTGADPLPVLQSACDDLYVIMLSGRPEARQAILDAVANAFISKVGSPERLLAAIACKAYGNRKVD